MINQLSSYSCGSSAEELYTYLADQRVYSTFCMVCKECGKLLVSIKDESSGTMRQNDYRRVSYFKCKCGKKYRKVSLDFNEGGYKCTQAMITREEDPLKNYRKKTKKRPQAYFVRIYMSRGRTLTYRVLPDSIKYKIEGDK